MAATQQVTPFLIYTYIDLRHSYLFIFSIVSTIHCVNDYV